MPSRPIPQRGRRRPDPNGRRSVQRHFLARSARSLIRADVTWTGGLIVGGSDTDVTFEHHQVPSNVRVLWDFDNDGDFDRPEEDVTSYFMVLDTFTGRDWPSQLTGKAGPGRFSGVVDNSDDRFSYFNAASPLNQNGNSLKTGRKIRVQTIEAGSPDPVLLVRDRFRRPDGALNNAETGQVWRAETADQFQIVDGQAMATNSANIEHIATLDVGATDAYIQATHGLMDATAATLFYRWQDSDNYGFASVGSTGDVTHGYVAGGVAIIQTFFGPYPSGDIYNNNVTWGVRYNGSAATVYLEGVAIGVDTAAPFSATRAGMSTIWVAPSIYRPGFVSFHAWSGLPVETEGVLWTGTLSDVVPDVTAGPYKTASVSAEGILSVAAAVDVSPEVNVVGGPTGIAVGQILTKAGLGTPPGSLDLGDIETGPHGYDRSNALNLARLFEETEYGFLHETQEGYPRFESRSARDSSYSLATFTDRPGGQYNYERITPRDWRREIINRVQAGVAPAACDETLIFTDTDSNSTAAGVANDVDVVLTSGIGEGALVLVLITSTVGFGGTVQWLEPLWWVALRSATDPTSQRIYAHISDGSESGDTVKFYDDTANAGGAWIAHTIVIPKHQWYGSHDGIAIAQHVPGDNPPALTIPWGLEPTLMIATHAGMVSIGGGSGPPFSPRPHGYGYGLGGSINGTVNTFDLFQDTLWKNEITRVEDPTEFGSGLGAGYIIVESTTIAVRGYNGDPIPKTGVSVIDREDLASQDAHDGTVRSHTGPDLFRHPAAAGSYCDRVLARHADDRPIFQIEFTATKSAAYRTQAVQRRVGHRITLHADAQTGFGVDSDYHIESIGHRFTDGCTNWAVTWELSPAENVNRADTTATELTAAVTATQDTFQVTVTDGPLWILSADHPTMFPFKARCGDEVMLVTAVTGASSPQTWTVVRAFNGWDQAHAGGTAVTLADQWTLP